jgi:tripartite-type tricarboxylate transporter receptor subunit TctC
MRQIRIRTTAALTSAMTLALALTLTSAGATAQTYPDRPIKIINPFGAGGISDVFMRPMIQKMSEWMGQQIVIENRPGASGAIGAAAVAQSPADGYTLLSISNAHTVNETLNPNRPYVLLRDFAPITELFRLANVLVVHPSVPARSVKELIALAKSQPGRLTYASSGSGSPFHLAGVLFNQKAGTDIVHVPYKVSGQARTDVIAGQVSMMFDTVVTMRPFVQSGKAVALATSSDTRPSAMPDLPTLAEAGLPGAESVAWAGLVAPAATPAPIVARLHGEIVRYMNLPETRALHAQQGMDAVGSTPEAFREMLRSDIDKWGVVVKAAGIKYE